jgi:hypothetical protein
MKNILTLFLFSYSFVTNSQNTSTETIKDTRIDILVKKQGAVIPPATVPQITGFRIQLFFDIDKKAVDDARNKFSAKFPKIDTYVIYNAPNYFLKVGNFRTQMEAEKIKKAIDLDFPTNYIVKELINLPRID